MPGYRPISEELRELVSLLNSHGVEYIVVGAHALAFHGVPRFTEDVDFFVSKSPANVLRIVEAFRDFGVEMPKESQLAMSTKDRGVLFLGHKPNRADFLNFLDGVEFEDAIKTKVAGLLAEQPVSYLSMEDYVATKKASGRPKDIADLAMLRAVHPEIEI